MDNGRLSKQSDTMAQGIVALDHAAASIQTVGTTVADAQAGFGTAWRGGASTNFGNALTVWLDDLQEILRNIDNLRETLAGVDKQFDNTEQDNALTALSWIDGVLKGGRQ